jgi:hypothetical protein
LASLWRIRTRLPAHLARDIRLTRSGMGQIKAGLLIGLNLVGIDVVVLFADQPGSDALLDDAIEEAAEMSRPYR